MTSTPNPAAGASARHAVEPGKPQPAAGPFVLNLCSSTTPMALSNPEQPELKRFSFFVSRRFEEGRERFRLHMGYFSTLAEAEEWLGAVRDIYPGAWAGEAPGKKLRERAVAAAAAQAQHAAGPPPATRPVPKAAGPTAAASTAAAPSAGVSSAVQSATAAPGTAAPTVSGHTPALPLAPKIAPAPVAAPNSILPSNIPTVGAAAHVAPLDVPTLHAPSTPQKHAPVAKPAPIAAQIASRPAEKSPAANTVSSGKPAAAPKAAPVGAVAAHTPAPGRPQVAVAPSAPVAAGQTGRPAITHSAPGAIARAGQPGKPATVAPHAQTASPVTNIARTAAGTPRVVTGTARSASDSPRAVTNTPRVVSDTPRAVAGPRSATDPRTVADTPRAVAKSAKAPLPNSNVREVLKALDETPGDHETTGETRLMPAPLLAQLDEPADDSTFTDTQVLKFLETRRADGTEISGVEVETGAISLLKPDDTGTRRALKEAVSENAPVWFAVQLQWSVQPVELSKVPPLAIFSAYTLYTVEGSRDGRKWYGLRLGFFSDAISAKQVAYYVRSEFASVAVVPVSPQEKTRASDTEKKADLAFPKNRRPEPADEFKLIDSDEAQEPMRPKVVAKPAAPAKAAAPPAVAARRASTKPSGRVRARESRSPQTLEETLEILGAGELEVDNGNGETLNESGVRHLRVEVQKNTPFGRLLERLSERVRKP